jgi:hypothetical protein
VATGLTGKPYSARVKDKDAAGALIGKSLYAASGAHALSRGSARSDGKDWSFQASAPSPRRC